MTARTSVADKTVLITGAARGIGARTAVELARRGARVALVGLEPELLAHNVAQLGDAHAWFEADVTDQSQLDAAVAGAVERFGGIDVVVANAGIANFGTVRTASVEDFERTIAINLVGVYRTIRSAVSALSDSRGYALVVASTASFAPMPGSAAYAASKAGAESLAASLRLELAPYGVRVGSAHPSWIDTDLVRDAEAALPTFAKMRSELPWPANRTTTVQECAVAFADAIERRAPRVYVPRSIAIVSALRPLLLTGVVQRLVGRKMGKDLRQIDREAEALGATWR